MLEKLFADKRIESVEVSDLSKFVTGNTGYTIYIEAKTGYHFDSVIKNGIKYEKDYFIVEGNTIEEALENAYNKLQEFK